jgi:hypothetical protein
MSNTSSRRAEEVSAATFHPSWHVDEVVEEEADSCRNGLPLAKVGVVQSMMPSITRVADRWNPAPCPPDDPIDEGRRTYFRVEKREMENKRRKEI